MHCLKHSDGVSDLFCRMLSSASAPPPNLILARDVTMHFPVPKRYRELLLRPFPAASSGYGS